MSGAKPAWAGVFPAVTTQFHADLSVDLPATQKMVRKLIEDGVDGIIACGSVGENSTLLPTEKRDIVAAIVEAAGGRVPVLAGLGESNTVAACDYARDMERLGGRYRGHLVVVAPGQELRHSATVGPVHARVAGCWPRRIPGSACRPSRRTRRRSPAFETPRRDGLS